MLKQVGVCFGASQPHEDCGHPSWVAQFHLSFPDNDQPVKPPTEVLKIVGGAPHGWGVWIKNEWYRVDISNIIDEITRLLEASR